MLKNLISAIKTPTIEFLCAEEDYGVIAEPYRAIEYSPDWWSRLKTEAAPPIKTVKRCSPFLDAMGVGWIIPLAVDVYIKTNSDISHINYSWTFDKKMIENHDGRQMYAPDDKDKQKNHPYYPTPILKFANYWSIKVPEGYSLLFTPPLNRPDKRFQCFSGVVDCDMYSNRIAFPFIFLEKDFDGVIEAGTPLVQVIPIKREKFKSVNRALTEKELHNQTKVDKLARAVSGFYRKKLWQKKIKNYE